MRVRGGAIAAGAYAATLARRFRDRAALERWQARRLDTWLQRHAAAVPAHASRAQAIRRDGLAALPVLDTPALLARYGDHNRLGLDAARAMDIAEGRAPPPPGHHVGRSTGTSPRPQPYLISEAERFVWLGTILAKVLGLDALRRPRVAIALPRGSALYDAAGASRALPVTVLPLAAGLGPTTEALAALRPDVLVGPPRLLRHAAEAGAPIAPARLVSAAEPLDPPDRAILTAAFPEARLSEVYMATEGLIATTCAHGTLHLCEDRMHVELEPAPAGLVAPVLTDFSRRAQIMARYRMGDLLRVRPPCPCGSALRAVQMVGRRADLIELPVPIPQDVLRDAILDVGGIDDFRLVQTGPADLHLTLPETAATRLPSARTALAACLARHGATAGIASATAPLAPPEDRKLRRVQRAWHP